MHRIVLTPILRHLIQNLRGKYKGKKLLAALAAEKQCEKPVARKVSVRAG